MKLQPVIVAIPQDAPARSPSHVATQRRTARLAVQHCATLIGAPLDGWQQDAEGVPQPNGRFRWSVSHKRQWAAAVIADNPVGIDIEHVAPRRSMLHDALADHKEWTLIGDRSWPAFFRLWTAKEAVLKANTMGISQLLACRLKEVHDECHMTLDYAGTDWRTEHFFHADHVSAVTCGIEPVDWRLLAETL